MFNMTDAKPVKIPQAIHFKLSKEQLSKDDDELKIIARIPYASTVGSLMYTMICMRPDIAHVVRAVSKYMANPGKQHWEAVKWILRYLKGTKEVGLCYRRGSQTLQGFIDTDLGRDADTRRSMTGYVYTIGGTAVSWISQLQKIVAFSTTEAEYVAITEASKEMIWLQNLLKELGREQSCSVLFCDSQSAIHLAKNPMFHARTKHIQLRYHFIRVLLEDGSLSSEKIQGSKNPADMLTKMITAEKLGLCMASINLQS